MIQGISIQTQAASQAAPREPVSDKAARAANADTPPTADSVELSSAANHALDAKANSLRQELVARVRAEISSGAYLTDEKLNATADTIQREVLGGA